MRYIGIGLILLQAFGLAWLVAEAWSRLLARRRTVELPAGKDMLIRYNSAMTPEGVEVLREIAAELEADPECPYRIALQPETREAYLTGEFVDRVLNEDRGRFG